MQVVLEWGGCFLSLLREFAASVVGWYLEYGGLLLSVGCSKVSWEYLKYVGITSGGEEEFGFSVRGFFSLKGGGGMLVVWFRVIWMHSGGVLLEEGCRVLKKKFLNV